VSASRPRGDVMVSNVSSTSCLEGGYAVCHVSEPRQEKCGNGIARSHGRGEKNMTTRTNLKAGGRRLNHNETLVRDGQAANLKIKTRIRAGFAKVALEYKPPKR
jgi:hypothetical protein